MRCQHRFRVQAGHPHPPVLMGSLHSLFPTAASVRLVSPPSLSGDPESGGAVDEQLKGLVVRRGIYRPLRHPEVWKAPSIGCRILKVASYTMWARVCVYAASVLHLHMQDHHHPTWGFRRRRTLGRREKGLSI